MFWHFMKFLRYLLVISLPLSDVFKWQQEFVRTIINTVVIKEAKF